MLNINFDRFIYVRKDEVNDPFYMKGLKYQHNNPTKITRKMKNKITYSLKVFHMT